MTAKYDPAEVVRLIVRARKRYAATGVVGTADALDMADQLAAARAEIEALTVAHNADRTEWMTTYEAMRAENTRLTEELAHATCADGDWLSKASRRMCETVMGDRDALRAKVRELEELVEALRCGDLGPFYDGELAPDRAAAFREHIARCKDCQADMRVDVLLDDAANRSPR